MTPGRNFKVGDVVLMLDEQAPRAYWPLGIIEEVYEGRDQLVRSVQVRTTSGVVQRPIQHICLLEKVSEENDNEDSKSDEGNISQPQSDGVETSKAEQSVSDNSLQNDEENPSTSEKTEVKELTSKKQSKTSVPTPLVTRSGREIKAPRRF